ncbi:hypothetical protein [Phyllobacterium sp. YR531]|uniref:hypothetical protein n=1 Tax=Phyllobacterium sp. YR531 TaxID=1144343 RepID=UPI00026F4A13|nr:hypothetical protein [Phyllobacterium sp. YR531]EJM98678.1 hypothetical protein PMI41_04438 [Phyllobacterium sp. YR531]
MTDNSDQSEFESLARIKLKQANYLVDDAGQPVEAVLIYDEILAGVINSDDLTSRELLADVMFHKSIALFDLGQIQNAVTLTNEMIARFSAAEFVLRKAVSHALYLAVFILRKEHPGHEQTLIEICDKAAVLFGKETDIWMRDRLLNFLNEKSFALIVLGQLDEAIALRNEVAARYKDDPDQDLRQRAERICELMDMRLTGTASG